MREESEKLTHRKLCEIGAHFLRTRSSERCPVVFIELASYSDEKPDVFGLNSRHSFLIECKTSRSDFLRDKKKYFREFDYCGVGDFRYYLCPVGVIKKDEVPEKWGLIWIDENGNTKVVKQILHGNINNNNPNRFIEKSIKNERCLMYAALRKAVNYGNLSEVL